MHRKNNRAERRVRLFVLVRLGVALTVKQP